MAVFRQSHGAIVTGSWKHQCRCGSIVGAPYRTRLWCTTCGVEKIPLGSGPCGCEICKWFKTIETQLRDRAARETEGK